ncbi:hypothetical protein GmHk_05G012862 [Glycine max]|nr:hypothetical protein GmHk_05G012862 [Glycine max]
MKGYDSSQLILNFNVQIHWRAVGSRQFAPNLGELTGMQSKRLIRQACEVLIFIRSLSQSTGLASHPLSAALLWLSARKNLEEG